MTVCIAAIYTVTEGEEWGIWAASDRLLTDATSHRLSEPRMTKHFDLGRRTIVLSAGSSTDDRPLMEAAQETGRNPNASVKDIANSYSEAFIRQRAHAGETYYLRPVDQTFTTFWQQLTDANSRVALHLMDQLQRGERDDGTPLVDVDALIFGLDPEPHYEPHIYRVCESERGEPKNYDTDGAATIGRGEDAAATYLTECGYVRSWSRDQVLFAVYAAKKRADKIESVGPETDLFEITKDVERRWHKADSDLVQQLGRIYEGLLRDEKKARETASSAAKDVLVTLHL